jgi:hypothetical protein
MALPDGRREVNPSREAMGERRKPGFGTTLNVSVPISFGLPLVVIGCFLVVAAVTTGGVLFYAIGGAAQAGGAARLAGGKRRKRARPAYLPYSA